MTQSNRRLLLSFYALLLITALSNCSKDGNNTPVSNTDLLSNQAWKIDKSGLDADKNGTIDLETEWNACELDNSFQFKKDGTGLFDEGPSKCNNADPQSSSFTWAFKNNEKILSGEIANLYFSGDANIQTLNNTNLEIYKDTTISGSPIPLRYIIRLKH